MLARAVEHAIRAAARAAGPAGLRRGGADARPGAGRGDRRRQSAGPAGARAAGAGRGAHPVRRGRVRARRPAARPRRSRERLGDAELGARAALIYGRVFTFGVVDPVLVGMLEESLEVLPPGDSAAARAPARAAGRGAAAQSHRPTSPWPSRARRSRPRAASATSGVARHALRGGRGADGHRRVDRDARAQPRGRAAGAGRGRSRAPAAHAPPPRDRATSALGEVGRVRRAPRRLRGAGRRAARALVRLVGAACCARCARPCTGASPRPRRLAAEAREAGRAAGHEAAERIWVTNREVAAARRRSSRRDAGLGARGPALRARWSTSASAWQCDGLGADARALERAADARFTSTSLPEGFRRPATTCSRSSSRRGRRVRRPARAGAGVLRGHQACARPCVMLGMSYLCWEGPWARVLALLAASLERWDEAFALFEDAIALCSRLDARPYLARTEYEYRARADRARGSRARQRADRVGAPAASELGMPGLVRLADARLAEIGGASRWRAARTPRAKPTPRPTPGAAAAPRAVLRSRARASTGRSRTRARRSG